MNAFKKSWIISGVYLLVLSAFLLTLFYSGTVSQAFIIVGLLLGFVVVIFAICNIYEKEIAHLEETLSHSADIETYCRNAISSFARDASSRSCNIIASMNSPKRVAATRNLITEYREMMESDRDSYVNSIDRAAQSFSFERGKHYEYYLKKKKEYLQNSLDEILNNSLQAIYEAQHGFHK
jgi:hypothetical protein